MQAMRLHLKQVICVHKRHFDVFSTQNCLLVGVKQLGLIFIKRFSMQLYFATITSFNATIVCPGESYQLIALSD